MKGLIYAAALVGVTSISGTFGFLALVAQAARRDRLARLEAELDTIPDPPALTRDEQVRRNAALRVACVGWSDCDEWDYELAHDRGRGER